MPTLALVYAEARALEQRVEDIDRQLARVAKADPVAQRLLTIPASVSSPRRRSWAPSRTSTRFAALGILRVGSDRRPASARVGSAATSVGSASAATSICAVG
jgi:hypothetical protein